MKPNKPTTMIDSLEGALSINENELDEACAAQPECFYRVAKEYAVAVSKRDLAKQCLAEISAEVDTQLRHEAEKTKERITEEQIKSRKALDDDVVEAQRILLELNTKVGEWSALKEAFEQRSYALKDMVSLWLGNYYGDRPTQQAGRQLRDEAAERVKLVRRERRRS